MPHYFYVLDGEWYQRRLQPALAASWRQRSFRPCLALCGELATAACALAETVPLDGSLPAAVLAGLSFDRNVWRCLVGEALVYGAAEIPEIQTSVESLTHLLAPAKPPHFEGPRERLAPIQQTYFGSQDLHFGGVSYRPEHVGLNDRSDVRRLADYLASLDPSVWTPGDLVGVEGLTNDEEREAELEYARQCLGESQQLYQRAWEHRQVIVCEMV